MELDEKINAVSDYLKLISKRKYEKRVYRSKIKLAHKVLKQIINPKVIDDNDYYSNPDGNWNILFNEYKLLVIDYLEPYLDKNIELYRNEYRNWKINKKVDSIEIIIHDKDFEAAKKKVSDYLESKFLYRLNIEYNNSIPIDTRYPRYHA